MDSSILPLRDESLNSEQMLTVVILYHQEKHPSSLDTYIWQDVDVAPYFPRLREFIETWGHLMDRKVHSLYLVSPNNHKMSLMVF